MLVSRCSSKLDDRGDLLTSRFRAEGRHGSDVIDLWPHHGRQRPSIDDTAASESDDDRRSHARRAGDVVRSLAAHRRRRDGGGADAGTRATRPGTLLSDDELAAIETTYPHGITAVQIVEVFTSRGVKFSEASFRKYVQQGLLPRSKRVGRKGKHRGSLGVYPAKTVRRINAVKRLMIDGHTIEEIQAGYLQYTDRLETFNDVVVELITQLARDVESPALEAKQRTELLRHLDEARRLSSQLTGLFADLTRRVAAPDTNRIRRTGAAGSAEDLL
jgi:hypothetical protein